MPSENQKARHPRGKKAFRSQGNHQNFGEASDLRQIRLMSCTITGPNHWPKQECGLEELSSSHGVVKAADGFCLQNMNENMALRS